MMNRGSANRRDQRLQTEAFQITHLDLFHNTMVTGKRRRKGRGKKPTSHITPGMNFRGTCADHHWLIMVMNEDLEGKHNS